MDKKVKIVGETSAAGPWGSISKGEETLVAEKDAMALVKAGYARLVAEGGELDFGEGGETGEAGGGETATAPAGETGEAGSGETTTTPQKETADGKGSKGRK